MKFIVITGMLFFILVAAIIGVPLLGTFVDLDSIVADTASTYLVQANPNTSSPAIPVTDSQSVALPIIEVEAAASALVSVEDATISIGSDIASEADLSALAELEEFAASVTNGYANLISGVYVPDALALAIYQQPSGSPGYITMQAGAATQFGMASDYGAIGILAHNFLSGDQFFQLEEGMKVYIIFGDGSYDVYLITQIRRFQALQPNSPYSNFLDLDNNNAQLSAAQLFDQVYNQAGKVVFQTCIEANGINTWGRLFVSAEPIETSE